MKRIKEIRKEGYNKEGKYEFIYVGDVLAALQDALVAEELFIAQREVSRTVLSKILMISYTFDIYHQSGECIYNVGQHTGACRFEFKSGSTDDKAANKCLMAGLKYFVLSSFKIPADDHNTERLSDGDADAGGLNDQPEDDRDRRRNEARVLDWSGPPPDDEPPPHAGPPPDGVGLRTSSQETPEFRDQVMAFKQRIKNAQNSDDADAIWRDEAKLLKRCVDTTYDHLVGSFETYWTIAPPKVR